MAGPPKAPGRPTFSPAHDPAWAGVSDENVLAVATGGRPSSYCGPKRDRMASARREARARGLLG